MLKICHSVCIFHVVWYSVFRLGLLQVKIKLILLQICYDINSEKYFHGQFLISLCLLYFFFFFHPHPTTFLWQISLSLDSKLNPKAILSSQQGLEYTDCILCTSKRRYSRYYAKLHLIVRLQFWSLESVELLSGSLTWSGSTCFKILWPSKINLFENYWIGMHEITVHQKKIIKQE